MATRVKIMSIFVFLFTLAGLAGCTSSTAFTKIEKDRIHLVSINPQVGMPLDISYYDRNQMAATMFAGFIGYTVARSAEQGKVNSIQSVMASNTIKIDDMLKNAFVNQLTSNTGFKLTSDSFGDAQFKLVINSYGFSGSGLSSDSAIPEISVNAKLVDAKGNTLWESTQKAILDNANYSTYKISDYLKNSLIMKKAFQTLTSDVSVNLIDNLESGNS